MRPLLIALQFLTCLPLRLSRAPQPEELGRSLAWYPLVGLLLGAVLWGLSALTGFLPVPLRAALLLAVWVLLTGGLHLDGLADCADAWVGGHGDRSRTLEIMKDPRAGPMAVVAIGVLLILKFAALQALLAEGAGRALLLPPLLGRTAMPLLFLTTPYLRAQGLGTELMRHLPRAAALAVTLLVLAATILGFGGAGWLAVLGMLALFALLRALLMRRLGGMTGDTAGAVLELVEACTLVLLAAQQAPAAR